MTTDIYDRTVNPDEIVFPGTRLGIIEEFYAGSGTFTDNEHIYAAVTGTVVIDTKNYEISIMTKSKMTVRPKVGSICLGSVVNVSRQMITVAIYYINNEEIYPTYTCIMHISQASKAYLDTADDAVSLGDIVRVRLIDTKTIPLQCSMIGSQLGVLITFCSRCGTKHKKIGRDKLKCPECNNVERRKTAIDYGNNDLQFKL